MSAFPAAHGFWPGLWSRGTVRPRPAPVPLLEPLEPRLLLSSLSDPVPDIIDIMPGEYIFHKELNGAPGFGSSEASEWQGGDSAGDLIDELGPPATWTFSLDDAEAEGFTIDPENIVSGYVEMAGLVDPGEPSFDGEDAEWSVNGDPADTWGDPLPFAAAPTPIGPYSDWDWLSFDVPESTLNSSTFDVSIDVFSGLEGGHWVALDWIELVIEAPDPVEAEFRLAPGRGIKISQFPLTDVAE
ncbi:MAG: hypothetical protein R6V58_09825, partial [Planctomycetota bacterium]